MKNIYMIILFFGMISCSDKKPDIPFNLIDYSCDDGWTSVYSVKIDSIGQTYIQGEDLKNGKWFIRTVITPLVFDSLCTLVNNINYANLDTLYKRNCVDCGAYYLIINQKNTNPVRIFVEGCSNNNDKELIQVHQLSEYLDCLVSNVRLKMESVQFESKTKRFYLFSAPCPVFPEAGASL